MLSPLRTARRAAKTITSPTDRNARFFRWVAAPAVDVPISYSPSTCYRRSILTCFRAFVTFCRPNGILRQGVASVGFDLVHPTHRCFPMALFPFDPFFDHSLRLKRRKYPLLVIIWTKNLVIRCL